LVLTGSGQLQNCFLGSQGVPLAAEQPVSEAALSQWQCRACLAVIQIPCDTLLLHGWGFSSLLGAGSRAPQALAVLLTLCDFQINCFILTLLFFTLQNWVFLFNV